MANCHHHCHPLRVPSAFWISLVNTIDKVNMIEVYFVIFLSYNEPVENNNNRVQRHNKCTPRVTEQTIWHPPNPPQFFCLFVHVPPTSALTDCEPASVAASMLKIYLFVKNVQAVPSITMSDLKTKTDSRSMIHSGLYNTWNYTHHRTAAPPTDTHTHTHANICGPRATAYTAYIVISCTFS